MKYTLEEKSVKIIGIKHDINVMEAYMKVPEIWKEFLKTDNDIYNQYHIGELTLSVNDENNFNLLSFYIGAYYNGDEKIEGLDIVELPKCLWVKFECIGSYPKAMQALNYEVYDKWFKEHNEYEIAYDFSIEELSKGDFTSENYKAALCLPLKKKV